MGLLALRSGALKQGPGGRQSVSGITATVFGANGFLGRYVVARLGEEGSRVVCPHRCDVLDMQHLRPMGDLGNIVTPENFSIRDDDMIRHVISKSNVVINLIGQPTETWNFGFQEVHTDFPRKLAQLCRESSQVERLIQVSSLGATASSPSPRLATRANGDAAVLEHFPDATILRFGALVGLEDRFFNDMALWRYSNAGVPVVDGGSARIQPTYVVDAAEAVYRTLQFEDAKGSTYDLGGPDIHTHAEWARIVCDEVHEERKLAQVPSFFAGPLAAARDWFAKRLPMHMMTRDMLLTSANIAEAEVDKVNAAGSKGFVDLQLKPATCMAGQAIDHVRYWRKGGYTPTAGASESM